MFSSDQSSALPALNLWRKNIGNKGIKKVAETLRLVAYSSVDLSFNGIESEGARVISEALKLCSSVVMLILTNNYIQDSGIIFISKLFEGSLCHLQHLSVGRNHIGPVGCSAFVNTLCCQQNNMSCGHLLHLDLQWNVIGNEGAKSLASYLQKCCSLRYLNVSRNYITDEGFIAFGEGIKVNSTLIDLILDFNEQTNAGDEAIALGLVVNRSIQDVGTDIKLRNYISSVFKIGDKVSTCAENKDIICVLRHRQIFFTLRYEFVLLRKLSLYERLFFKLGCEKNGAFGQVVQWFVDATDLIFYHILTYLCS